MLYNQLGLKSMTITTFSSSSTFRVSQSLNFDRSRENVTNFINMRMTEEKRKTLFVIPYLKKRLFSFPKKKNVSVCSNDCRAEDLLRYGPLSNLESHIHIMFIESVSRMTSLYIPKTSILS